MLRKLAHVVGISLILLSIGVFLQGSAFADVTPPKLYFGQPVAAFNSQTVERLLPIIQQYFSGWNIENPNQPKHQEGYQKYKKETGKGMNYYFESVLPNMRGGIFLAYPDGTWGAGVYGEALFIEKRGYPIWVITPDGAIKQTTTEEMYLSGGVLSIARTRKINEIPYDELLRRHNAK